MFATLMQGTQGREKMCGLLQYSFTMYHECMRSSDEVWNHQHWSLKASQRVARNVSNSRKMLKFLQFMESLKKIYNFNLYKAQGKSLFRQIIEQTRNVSAFVFYLADNIVWLQNIGIIERITQNPWPWLGIKDLAAIVKNVSGLIKSLIERKRRKQRLREISDKLEVLANKRVTSNEDTHTLLK
jgi:predicted DCC family thiol-disulfide oxidoreductase YuxK